MQLRQRMQAFGRPVVAPRGWVFLLVTAGMVVSPVVAAQEMSRRWDLGIEARYMPTGWFHWSSRPGGTSSDLGAYPALGGAPFIDYRLSRVVSIGFMPEIALNVIPRTTNYPVSAMLAGSLRLKLELPALGPLLPYLVLSPGYSAMFAYDNAGADSGDAHGFVVSGYGGARIPINARHCVLAAVGYMRGFQRSSGHDYAPSYLVLAAGWQVSL